MFGGEGKNVGGRRKVGELFLQVLHLLFLVGYLLLEGLDQLFQTLDLFAQLARAESSLFFLGLLRFASLGSRSLGWE